MDPVWIVNLEVLAFIDASPNTRKLGSINIVASAPDENSVIARVRECLKDYNWEILGIESVLVADTSCEYQDDLSELIEQVTANPNLILLSTLYSYKPN
jgi:hypothetical protein